ncbi:MAG: hypothetical protein KC501_30450 [Myxococcales bacterium]|nr:hypothetical protein [Myxococcales bacterium]
MATPTIYLAPRVGDHFEVQVEKEIRYAAASGRLLVYPSDPSASSAEALADLESTWTSGTDDVRLGRGTVHGGAAGLWLVATQTQADGSETRSEPYQLSGWPA